MANSSFLRSYDLALKLLIYDRFGSNLGIDTQHSIEEENINEGVFQFPKDTAMRIAAEKRGENFLEFINFYREGTSFSWDRNRSVVSRRGMWVSTSSTTQETAHVKAVPVDLRYNVWFWSKDLDKIYECMEDYIFWQQDNPKVSLKYNDLYEITPDIHLGDIVDESTVPEEFEKGIVFCFKMPIKIDAWIFRGLSFKTISKIVVTFYDKDQVENYEEIIVDDSDQNTELEAALRFFRRNLYDIYEIDLTNNLVKIFGNFPGDFSAGEKFRIQNSTGNDGIYTVVSSGYASDVTSVKVTETLQSSVADGSIYKVE